MPHRVVEVGMGDRASSGVIGLIQVILQVPFSRGWLQYRTIFILTFNDDNRKTHGSRCSVVLHNSPVIGNLEVLPAKEAGIILLVSSHGSGHFYFKRMQSNSLKTLRLEFSFPLTTTKHNVWPQQHNTHKEPGAILIISIFHTSCITLKISHQIYPPIYILQSCCFNFFFYQLHKADNCCCLLAAAMTQ